MSDDGSQHDAGAALGDPGRLLSQFEALKPRHDLELLTHISLKHRYVYFQTTKCASGTIRYYLQEKEFEGSGSRVQDVNNRYMSPHLCPYQLPESRFLSILGDRSYRKIGFVRHPWTRLLSCYLHRIVAQPNSPSARYFRKCFPSAPTPPSFADFIASICDQSSRDMDTHWRVQSDELLYGLVTYDFIGHVESLGADLVRLGELLFPDVGFDLDPENPVDRSSMKTDAADHIDEYFTGELIERIGRRYSSDFEHFGYSSTEATAAQPSLNAHPRKRSPRSQQECSLPLYKFSAPEALAHRKTNVHGVWGDRASVNRVEPIAKPHFAVPFRIQPGELIFTVGSCFARNVEEELIKRGFVLPMRSAILQQEFSAVLNNYGTPSIYNEFAWAFGAQEYRPQEHIVEVTKRRFADLQLSPSMRPEPYERVLARRRAITGAYRGASTCRVIIMTLGLVECWYDTTTGYYLNVGPRPAFIKKEPARFELHVLSFAECYHYLQQTIALLEQHGPSDLRVLLTVSPVPMNRTHRLDDVMVANCYSKSVLRAAAETLVAKYPFVTYYPSYESVTLSDRRRAWRDDFVHVTHELVALNVGRMVDAFIEGERDIAVLGADIAAGGMAMAVERAKAVRAGSREVAEAFFERFGHLSREAADFALEHVQFLIEADRCADALQVLDGMPQDLPEIQPALLRSQALVALGRPTEALAFLEAHSLKTDGPSAKRLKSGHFWREFMHAAIATGQESLILTALARTVMAMPAHAAAANLRVARWFHVGGHLDRAIDFYATSISLGDPTGAAYLGMAEALFALGRREEARRALSEVRPRGRADELRIERLTSLLSDADAAADALTTHPIG